MPLGHKLGCNNFSFSLKNTVSLYDLKGATVLDTSLNSKFANPLSLRKSLKVLSWVDGCTLAIMKSLLGPGAPAAAAAACQRSICVGVM